MADAVLAVDEGKSILREERHVFGEVERLMTEVVDVGELGCISKLLNSPLSVLRGDQPICTSEHQCHWVLDHEQIVSRCIRLPILFHVLFGAVVKPTEPGVFMTNKLSKMKCITIAGACKCVAEVHVPPVLFVDIHGVSVSSFNLFVTEFFAEVAANHVVL